MSKAHSKNKKPSPSPIRPLTILSPKSFYTKNALQTRELGRAFAERLKGGDIVFLSGGLGQGKTTFMQGIAKFFGNKGFARSSSFILANEYKGPNGLKLFHLDLYRLRPQETLEFGVEEYLYSGNIAVVEWPERLGENYICTWLIKFEDDCPMQRKIIIIKRGKK